MSAAPESSRVPEAPAAPAGAAAPVVLAATHERALDVVPVEWLREHAVDVPDDPSRLA